MSDNLKDLAHRAWWTAVETFISLVVIGGVLDLGVATLESAALAAGASVLTVVKVYAHRQLQKK